MKKHTHETLAKRRRLERTTQLIRELPTASPLCAHCNNVPTERREALEVSTSGGVRCKLTIRTCLVRMLYSRTTQIRKQKKIQTTHSTTNTISLRCGHRTRNTTLPAHLFNGVACRTFRLEIAARIRPFVTCVEMRKRTEGPNCVSELANQRSKHIRQLTSSASFLTTVQATAEPHTLFEQRAKMIETATCSRNAKS